MGQAQLIYPEAKKIPQLEMRFGQMIMDDYKWMENSSDPDLWDWIDVQKDLTASVLDQHIFDNFYNELKIIRALKKEQESAKKVAQKVAFDEPIPYTNPSEENAPSKKEYGEDFTVSTQTVHGGDLRRVIVQKKSDNSVVDILLVKFYAFVKWDSADSFFYTSDRDERLGGGKSALLRHKVGTIQSEDETLYQCQKSNSSLSAFTSKEKLYIKESFSETSKGFIALINPITKKLSGKVFYEGKLLDETTVNESISLLSFKDANNGKINQLRLRDGETSMLIPEQDFVIDNINDINGNHILVIGHKDASGIMAIFDQKTKKMKVVEELMDGNFSFVSKDNEAVKVSFQSYEIPKKIFSLNKSTLKLELVSEEKYPFDVSARKLHYTASNGQQAAMWVLSKKGNRLQAKTPMILYGYGGFLVTVLPSFNPIEIIPWLEKGGAITIVSLPGSLAYGKSWNDLAKSSGRIHSFDSFAAAAKELIRLELTSSEHLGMTGISNGGLLVAGTLQRHPELFKAAIPQVGVLDMINFNIFSAGKYWTWDYGNPFIEKDFKGLWPISPYHNILKRK